MKRLVNERTVEKEFKCILNEFQVPMTLVHTKKSDHPSSLVSVTWSGNQVTLLYSPQILSTVYDLTELKAILRHEICHIITAPDPRVPTLDVDNPYIETAALHYVDVFREYLAENEFNRRFPNHRRYLQFKKRIFHPDKSLDEFLKNDNPNPFDFFSCLFGIYYDAIYFTLVHDATFQRWCAARYRHGFAELFQYIIEDVAYIDGQDTEYRVKLNLMLHSFNAVVHVDAETLWTTGEVQLIQDISKADTLDRGLADLWKRRNLVTADSTSHRAERKKAKGKVKSDG